MSSNRYPISGKLLLLLFSIVAVPAAIVMGYLVGESNLIPIIAVLGGMIGILICLPMGQRVWWLIPLTLATQLPPIPFAGRQIQLREMAIAAAFCFFFLQFLMQRQPIYFRRPENIGVFGYFAWVLCIYYLNPVGLSSLGSDAGGGRGYLTIGIALLSYLVISNQKISEFEAKGIIWCLILGAIVSAGWNFIRYNLGSASMMMGGPGESIDGEYTWHQGLAQPSFWIMLYVFSRYSFKETLSFKHPLLIVLVIGALVLGIISGKRAVFIATVCIPFLAAFLRKDWLVVAFLGLILPLGIFLLAAGHGTYYQLPFTAQRALAVVPGDWDPDVIQQTDSEFRPALRAIALDRIKENPWVGRKGFKVDFNVILDAVYGQIGAPQALEYRDNIGIQRFAMTGSWHTTWLGIAADFGIPAAVLFAIFFIQAIVLGMQLIGNKKIQMHSAYLTLVMMLTMNFIIMLLRSWTSGSSSGLPMALWWQFGILIALKYGPPVRESKEQPVLESPQPRKA